VSRSLQPHLVDASSAFGDGLRHLSPVRVIEERPIRVWRRWGCAYYVGVGLEGLALLFYGGFGAFCVGGRRCDGATVHDRASAHRLVSSRLVPAGGL